MNDPRRSLALTVLALVGACMNEVRAPQVAGPQVAAIRVAGFVEAAGIT